MRDESPTIICSSLEIESFDPQLSIQKEVGPSRASSCAMSCHAPQKIPYLTENNHVQQIESVVL